MKFAHLADIHIGGWRDEYMRTLACSAFEKALDICVLEGVSFIIIAGDLFNTALPGIDRLKLVAKRLRELKKNNIPVYVVPGSHDYSPTGKTMIDVFEHAGLLVNVYKGTITDGELELHPTKDQKTGVSLVGILGKAGMLDQKLYKRLHKQSLEALPGEKIFVFHTALTELEQPFMDSMPLTNLPKGFTYYAGGHVHIRKTLSQEGYAQVVYPGPVFPNNFSELEELHHGSMCIVENFTPRFVPLIIKEHVGFHLREYHTTPDKLQLAILKNIDERVKKKLITLRIEGSLETGAVSDIDWQTIIKIAKQAGAVHVLRNTFHLQSVAFEAQKTSAVTPEAIEDEVLGAHLNQSSIPMRISQIKNLLSLLAAEKHDGESIPDYEDRVYKEIMTFLEL